MLTETTVVNIALQAFSGMSGKGLFVDQNISRR
jgi:hypothetical protein